MPEHMSHTVRWGSTDRTILVFAHDGTGRGKAGLSPASPGASAAYVREGGGAVSVPLDGLVEVDSDLATGVYRLPLPDELLAPGAAHAIVLVRFDDAVVGPVELELVAYDPLDESCIGMTQLGDRKRHEFLRRALPRFTEMEFEAGMDREKRLTDFIDERGGGN